MENHHEGLQKDLELFERALNRRGALKLFGAVAGLGAVARCAGSGGALSASATSTAADGTECTTVPEETAGPYPGDGSNANGKSALILSGVVRSDITSSVGNASGVAAGVPLTVRIKVVDVKSGCVALAGAAVYIWHCDRDGNYSMYTLPTENYLRGVQEADADGFVTFKTIYPGAYSGRWPHIHFEIYPSLAKATSYQNKMKTSQIALPKEVCDSVYTVSGYEKSVANMKTTSLSSDNVFSDGYTLELASVSGDIESGLVATLVAGV